MSWGGTQVALKELHAVEGTDSELEAFVGEISILASLRHPHCLLILGLALDDPLRPGLLSELCLGGSLWNVLHSEPARILSPKDCLRIAQQTASAMSYLHAKKILHLDLKSPNVLLTAALDVRVSDFGLSRLQGSSSTLTVAGLVKKT